MTSQPTARQNRRAALAVAGLVVLFCAPMFVHPNGLFCTDAYRATDWLHDLTMHLHLREALVDYGEFPLRTHLFGGGYPILGHPSDGSFSPTAWLFVLLPTELAIRALLMLLLWCGSFGVYLLARDRLELSPFAAGTATAAFAFAGWLPSFMLTGFLMQAYYLVAPMVLYLLAGKRASWQRSLGAGLLLLFLFFQAGNGFLVVVHFLLFALWLFAAQDQTTARRGSLALAVFIFLAASNVVSLHQYVSWPVAFGLVGLFVFVAAVWLPLRELIKAFRPYLFRLSLALIVVVVVGAAKWIPMLQLIDQGHYFHAEHFMVGDGYPYVLMPYQPVDRQFYHSLPTFLQHVNRSLAAKTTYPDGLPQDDEYLPLGVTYGIAIAFLLAAIFAWRKFAPFVVFFVFYAFVCFGPNLSIDPYRLLIWGLPGLARLFNPLKYFNFFLVLSLTMGFGVLVGWLFGKIKSKAPVVIGSVLLLCWPLVQNAPLFATLFEKPYQPLPAEEQFYQVHLLPERDNLTLDREDIWLKVYLGLMHERGRPENAVGFYNLQRGIGTLDWYADLLLPQAAEPKHYVLPTGELVDNPAYRGEIWCTQKKCEPTEIQFSPNRIAFNVDVDGPSVVVINQNYDPVFVVNTGRLSNHDGLLAVRLPAAGRYEIKVSYRPRRVMLGMMISLAGFLLVSAALIWRGAVNRLIEKQ